MTNLPYWPWRLLETIRFIVVKLIIRPLSLATPFLKQRLNFERQTPFWGKNISAAAAFEVSSQGELEQIVPVLEHYMSSGKQVILLYCSPSAHNNVAELKKRWGDLLQARALPLLSRYIDRQARIEHWSLPDVFYMTRYDFFPELMLLRHSGRQLVLLSATLVNHWPLRPWPKRHYWHFIMRHFDFILASSASDYQRLLALGILPQQMLTLEWRLDRIVQRLAKAPERLESRKSVAMLAQYLREKSGKSMIMGSVWPADLELVNSGEWKQAIASAQVTLVLAPHRLDDLSISEVRDALARHLPGLPIYELRADDSYAQCETLRSQWTIHPGIIILRMGGVLCESYQFFSLAYVGGGLGRSIHSVLEPWPSCPKIACGPKIHRSTEFEWIKHRTPERIAVVHSPAQLWQVLHGAVFAKNQVQHDLAIALEQQHNDKEQFYRWINHVKADI